MGRRSPIVDTTKLTENEGLGWHSIYGDCLYDSIVYTAIVYMMARHIPTHQSDRNASIEDRVIW